MRCLLVAILLVSGVLGGCGSTPGVRNIDAVYRFENLRKDTQSVKGRVARDEWASVRPILERASAKKIEVSRSGVRAYGSLELANYECRCVLRSLDDFLRVQSELDAFSASEDSDGERVETHLAQIGATYKSNFVLATVNVAVSGATVGGHRVRLFAGGGEPPVETIAGSSGIWSVRVSIVPQSTWIYGLSEDPSGRVPTQYFRINAATRKQERVEEAEFLKLFPPNAPASGAGVATPKPAPTSSPVPSNEERRIREQRNREDEEIRKRREADEKRRRQPAAP